MRRVLSSVFPFKFACFATVYSKFKWDVSFPDEYGHIQRPEVCWLILCHMPYIKNGERCSN